MARQFRDEHREAQNWNARAGLWIHALCDIAISAPKELARELGQDLAFAIRVYRKRPLNAFLAIGALALAIGVSTGIFSVTSALLLRSLPFADAARLVEIRQSPFTAGNGRAGFTEWQGHSAYLSGAATFSTSEMNLNSGRDAVRVRVSETSANFFSLLGATSGVGRTFASNEDITGQNHVAVISHRLWLQSFGGDSGIIGRIVHLNGASLTVIGVAKPSFDYPGNVDIWTPTVFDFETIPKRGAFLWQTIGRLRAGISMARAREELAAEAWHFKYQNSPQQLPQSPQQSLPRNSPQDVPRSLPQPVLKGSPQGLPPSSPQNLPQNVPQSAPQGSQQSVPQSVTHKSPDGDQVIPDLVSFRDQLASQLRGSLLILSVVVLLVLLTACANIAQLLLSRTAERRQELALRAALGASRSRLVQQLTVEATMLTVAGSIAGLVVTYFVCNLAGAVLPAQLATQKYTLLDWRVLCFAIALALLVGATFGVMPSWVIARLQPATQLSRVPAGTGDPLSRRLRSILIGMQVAFTLTLLVSALTLGSAFMRLLDTDLGFRPANVITFHISLQGTRYQRATDEWQYYASVLDRLRSIPGVESAGAVNYLPLSNNVLMAGTIKVDSGEQIHTVVMNGAMPGYFRTMGTKLVAGREFVLNESASAEHAVIVNEAFAHQAGMGSGIVGRRIVAPWTNQPYQVVGLVASARMAGPEYEGTPQVYWPVQEEPPANLTFVAKVRGDSSKYLGICREAVSGLDRSVPLYDVMTLDQRLSQTLGRPRFYTISVLFLGCLAMLLAIIGVYGSSSRAVTQRECELGVRMALGASTRTVRTMIVRQSLAPIAVGIIAGIAATLGSGPLLEHLFLAVKRPDMQVCIVASIFLMVISLVAAWLATTRILAIDPINAIRAE